MGKTLCSKNLQILQMRTKLNFFLFQVKVECENVVLNEHDSLRKVYVVNWKRKVGSCHKLTFHANVPVL